MNKVGNSVEQVYGGSVIKQGDQTPFGFVFRDEAGETVNIKNATVKIKIANEKALLLEKNAVIKDDYVVEFSLGQADITGSGDMRLEFTVTYSNGLQEKFPSDDWQRIKITPTLDDITQTNIAYLTFEKMKADFTQKVDDLNKRVDNLVAEAGNSNPEIAEARGTYGTLQERLDADQTALQAESDKISILQKKVSNIGINAVAEGFKGDGTTADLQLLNSIITSAPANAVILVPDGTYKLNGGLTPLKNGKRLIGLGKPTLDFSTAPDGITAVTIDTQRLPIPAGIENLVIKGNSVSGQAGTSIGLNYTGSATHMKNVEIVYFGTGLYLSNTHMYINTFDRVWIHRCGKGVQFPDDTLTPGINDCGENLRFVNCNISDNTIGFVGGLTTTDVHFYACSIDYNVRMSQVKHGAYNFYGGHVESNIATSLQGYLFDVLVGYSPSFSFHGTTISAYGIKHLFNPDPAIRGFSLFYAVTGFANGSSDNADKGMKSQTRVLIPAGQTSVTVDHFLSSSSLAMTSVKCYIPGGQIADITTEAITPTVKLTTGTNTLTITIPTTQSKTTFIMLQFG
ncbi:glycosyl hydrolase family 28-related protein [Priestia megaterium]